jgi:hypothetical protein
MVAPDAQKRVEFAVDPDVDVLPGVGAYEMQPFHGGLRFDDGPIRLDLTWMLDSVGGQNPVVERRRHHGTVSERLLKIRSKPARSFKAFGLL